MAVVTVRTEPFTVGIEKIRYVDGEKFFPTCSCGWQGVMLFSIHQHAKDELRHHMVNDHPMDNRKIVARLVR